MGSMETKYTYCSDSISDLHKDAYGFRPGVGFWERWESATDDERQAEWDWLLQVLDRVLEEEAAASKAAVERFEQHVTNTICMGARDRETALRWIMDASNANGDWEYLCYDFGLPFGYFKKAA